MWDRKELKREAIGFLKSNFHLSLIIVVLMTLFGGYHTQDYFSIRKDKFLLLPPNTYDSIMSTNTDVLSYDAKKMHQIDYIQSEMVPIYRNKDMVILKKTYDRTPITKMMDFLSSPPWSTSFHITLYKILMFYEKNGLLYSILLLVLVLFILLKIFIYNPISYGGHSFFLRGIDYEVSLSDIINAFKEGSYSHIVATLLLRDIFTLLWMLLFFIPQCIIIYFLMNLFQNIFQIDLSVFSTEHLIPDPIFIIFILLCAPIFLIPFYWKKYQYSMIPYILDDEPELGVLDTISESKKITKGHKLRMFFLDLSFIGWYILGTFLFSIGKLFVFTYYLSTKAHLYIALISESKDQWY